MCWFLWLSEWVRWIRKVFYLIFNLFDLINLSFLLLILVARFQFAKCSKPLATKGERDEIDPFLYGRIICVNQSFKYSPSTADESTKVHPHNWLIRHWYNGHIVNQYWYEFIQIYIVGISSGFRILFNLAKILSPHKYAHAHTIYRPSSSYNGIYQSLWMR
jgi:hypothetical protein